MRRAATSDIFAARIVPFLEDAVRPLRDAALSAAVVQVRAWVDAGAPLVSRGGVVPDPGAAIYTEFRTAAQRATFADELGTAFRPMFYPQLNDGDQEDDHGSFGTPDALFLRVLLAAGAVRGAAVPRRLRAVSRNYFDDVATGAHAERADVLVAALRQAVATLTARFGSADPAAWQMPALRAQYMDLGAASLIFGPSVIERENRGTFNLVVELGQPVRGQIVVPPGESGTITAGGGEPPHLRDQLRLYEAFEYRRQPFTEQDLQPPVTIETVEVAPPGR